MTSDSKIREQAERYFRLSGEYGTEYERKKLIANWEKKEHDADALVSDFQKRAGTAAQKRILELGFGTGLHIPAFVRAGAEVHGLEVNPVLLEIGQENMRERGVAADLRLYDGTHMPFSEGYFDYVFATSVLEHVSDLRSVLREADRVLKQGGRFYISFPNRWAPRETHTGFYFVQYLPRRAAEVVLRALGSNAVEEINMRFLSFTSFKRSLSGTHLRVLYETESSSAARRLFKRSFARIGLHHSSFLRTIMVVLEKT